MAVILELTTWRNRVGDSPATSDATTENLSIEEALESIDIIVEWAKGANKHLREVASTMFDIKVRWESPIGGKEYRFRPHDGSADEGQLAFEQLEWELALKHFERSCRTRGVANASLRGFPWG